MASGEATDVTAIYVCTKRLDCGVQQCCTRALGPDRTFCANQCDLTNHQIVCDKDADCAALDAAHCPGASCTKCRKPQGEQSGKLPPWMKFCTQG
jgi:hypothetical protein